MKSTRRIHPVVGILKHLNLLRQRRSRQRSRLAIRQGLTSSLSMLETITDYHGYLMRYDAYNGSLCIRESPPAVLYNQRRRNLLLHRPQPKTTSLDNYCRFHTPQQLQSFPPSRPKMQALYTKHSLIPISNSRPSVLLNDTDHAAFRSPSCMAAHQA